MSSTSTKSADGHGRLSVVATPIGNLDDVTLRALATLKAADAILAEDTRRTKRLCAHHGIGTKLRSFHAYSGDGQVTTLVREMVDGAHFALVTDAGTPVVSDPGIRLVSASRGAGVDIETIPGPSAVIAAIAIAGVRVDAFRFIGFLPRSGGRRKRIIEEITKERGATVLFESPNRIGETLADLMAVLGDTREVAMCRELTKIHEEVLRGPIAHVRARVGDGVRGEVTLVIAGTGLGAGASEAMDEEEARALARELLAEGLTARDVARRLSQESGMARKEAYALVIALGQE